MFLFVCRITLLSLLQMREIHLVVYTYSAMLTAKNKAFIFETLGRMFPENVTELNYTTPFQLLIAVIMSAQTTDKQVNKVTATLFEQIREPADVVEM